MPAASDNVHSETLTSVGLTEDARGKPYRPAPRFWNQQAFYNWLKGSANESGGVETYPTVLSPTELGHGGPLRDQRLHVRLDQETLAAMEGFLFLTEGRAFARPPAGVSPALPPIHMALAVQTEAELKEGIAPLGGERRLMRWYRSKKQVWPEPPEELLDTIVQEGACRILLLTPAHFEQGWRPTWLLQQSGEAQARLAAAAIGRPQVVSGWDFERNRPKPSRRLAPAGSVFFLRLGPDPKANRRWAESLWMSCVSDDEQSRKDGFGLAVLGSWSGQLAPMKESSV
jgi:CRISPR-associated protein Cmr3